MAGNVDNIVLEHLRHIRDRMDGMAEDVQTLTLHVGSIERILAGQQVGEASQSLEIDRFKLRMNRVERRLDPEPPPVGE